MIRLFILVVIAFLSVAGCQAPGSVAEIGKFVKSNVQPETRAKVAHADIFVMFAEIKVGAVKKYCPVAAITVDDECDVFSTKRLDTVCRWAGDTPGKARLKNVQWKSAVDQGQPQQQFSIEFKGAASPCTVDPLPAGPAVNCVGKNAKALGLPEKRSNNEVDFDYVVKAGGCPILDPYTIWRR